MLRQAQQEGNSNSGTSVAFLTQLPDATEGKASRAAAGHLGQCAGPLSASSGVGRRCGNTSGRLVWS